MGAAREGAGWFTPGASLCVCVQDKVMQDGDRVRLVLQAKEERKKEKDLNLRKRAKKIRKQLKNEKLSEEARAELEAELLKLKSIEPDPQEGKAAVQEVVRKRAIHSSKTQGFTYIHIFASTVPRRRVGF